MLQTNEINVNAAEPVNLSSGLMKAVACCRPKMVQVSDSSSSSLHASPTMLQTIITPTTNTRHNHTTCNTSCCWMMGPTRTKRTEWAWLPSITCGTRGCAPRMTRCSRCARPPVTQFVTHSCGHPDINPLLPLLPPGCQAHPHHHDVRGPAQGWRQPKRHQPIGTGTTHQVTAQPCMTLTIHTYPHSHQNGRTPLHFAAEYGHAQIAQLLLTVPYRTTAASPRPPRSSLSFCSHPLGSSLRHQTPFVTMTG